MLCRLLTCRMDQFPLLDPAYDEKHRTRMIEQGEVNFNCLHFYEFNKCNTYCLFYLLCMSWTPWGQWHMRPLRPWSMTSATHPLLKHAKLTTVARVCRRGVPPFNPAVLTAMIDRWWLETHNFHLPCGEMTITLEDAAMILGLKIQGFLVIGDTKSAGWEDHVA